jgi:hypothetical protein
MKARYFFVELLAQNIYAYLVGIAVLPEIELRQDLIGKRIRHDKARVTCGAAEVYQPTFGQQENLVAIREGVFIYLRFDVGALDSFGRVQRVDLNSLSKWPMFATMAWSFIRSMCSSLMTSTLPVAAM